MKKKIIALCLIVALAATAVIGGTLAYFTDNDKAENVFTVGKVDIILTEPNWTSTGSQDAPAVYPGEPLAKDPTVTVADGSNPCFVRLKVTGLDQFGTGKEIVYLTNYEEGKLGEGWVKHTDGFFYWTKPLVEVAAVSDTWNSKYDLTNQTTALFDQIKMPTGLDGTETEIDPIVVYAQAVQAQGAKNPNWAAVNGMNVEEIAAWFTVCGMGDPAAATTPGA